MALFGKNRKLDGWLAISPQPDGVRAACVRRIEGAPPKVERAAFYPLAKASAESVLERLAKDLDAARRDCTTLLAADEYQLLLVDAPTVPPDELKAAIRWRVKDMLDFHVGDATIDVLDVPPEKDAPARNHSMYVVAARNQLLAQRQELFGAAKIPLSVIDVPEMAQRNVAALLEPPGRGLALLSFGIDGGLLTVTYGGELYLSRRIDVRREQLADTQQREACLERITLELQRSLDHCDRQYHFITLAKLVLAPLAEAGPQLLDYLAANLYLPVEALDLSGLFDLSAVEELRRTEQQERYFLTLGAALRHEEKSL
ncbi:MAG: agglutinin biogenesis protein MshI [Burkholderiaceae bacterium]